MAVGYHGVCRCTEGLQTFADHLEGDAFITAPQDIMPHLVNLPIGGYLTSSF